MFEQRRPGKANEGSVGQCQPHVASKFTCLGAMRLIGNHDDVITRAVRFTWVDVLIELVNQAENESMILLQYFS